MNLGKLLDGVQVTKLFELAYGQFAVTHDLDVPRLQYDSRKVERGDCFVALRGSGTDGHQFVGTAVERGAKVVVMEDDQALPDAYCMHHSIVKIVVRDSRKALALMAANYFAHPSASMTMVGVTGTNGKTTTTHIIKGILEEAGQRVGLIGTIEYKIGNEVMPATHTTPESLELNDLLSRMRSAGCESVSMEVSSHALQQSRVHGLGYRVAVFTNLTQDHLDYHGSMEEYFRAKKILFDELPATASAVVNSDDPWGTRIASSTRSRTLTYGTAENADVRATDITLSLEGTSFTVLAGSTRQPVSTPLVGRFNVYNTLAAFAAGTALGLPPATITTGIRRVNSVRGRFERISSPAGWSAIIDYAHTPDALEKCLQTIREVLPAQRRGRIITIFGAGGDRDRTKRPLMGRVAASLSDRVIVTSDNPRTEDANVIIDDIVAGIGSGVAVVREPDRRRAITSALREASAGDVLLIAGKGHEDYQVIGKTKIHFSDREIVEEFIRG
jgi:UDP-N-acetylmuramoyl-L-alanyl-D-glutamate--2,6-diaminopimelate ligase